MMRDRPRSTTGRRPALASCLTVLRDRPSSLETSLTDSVRRSGGTAQARRIFSGGTIDVETARCEAALCDVTGFVPDFFGLPGGLRPFATPSWEPIRRAWMSVAATRAQLLEASFQVGSIRTQFEDLRLELLDLVVVHNAEQGCRSGRACRAQGAGGERLQRSLCRALTPLLGGQVEGGQVEGGLFGPRATRDLGFTGR